MQKLLFITGILFFISANAYAGPNLTREHPITFDKDKKIISFLAEVNGKYLYKPTRHFAVYEKGRNGEKAVFRALVSHLDFYDALMKIKAEPGNNMTFKNKETTHVKGREFKVTVTWEGAGRDYSIDEVMEESNKAPIVMKFGGNLENAASKNTGCLLCLDSCPVGIVSNSIYTYGAISKRKEVSMQGNKAILPPDGTKVIITLATKLK